MIRLVVEGYSLDLQPNASIRIKLRSPAFLGQDVDKIKGSFSFPFTVLMTPGNRRTLRYPDRLDNSELLSREFSAQLYVGPDRLLDGKLSIRNATRTSAEVFLTSNPLKDLTKIRLNETEQGTIGADSESELASLMMETARNPLEHDAVFAPVYNGALRDGNEFVPAADDYFNSYHWGDQRFQLQYHVSPLPRVEVILRRAIEGAGYTFRNGLHDTDEMKRQVIVSSRSMRFEDALVTRIPLAMCLPAISISDFLKSLCRTYCLAPFSDLSGTHLELMRLGPLLSRAPRQDWTQYADHDYERDPTGAAVLAYAWGDDAYTSTYHFSEWSSDHPIPDREIPDIIGEDGKLILIPPEETVYLYARSAISRRINIQGLKGLEQLGSFGFHRNLVGNDTVTPSFSPAQTHVLYSVPNDFDASVLPTISASVVGATKDPSQPGVVISETGSVEGRLSFYRGFQPTKRGELYPMVNHANHNSTFQIIDGEVESLNWLGPDGLYPKYWRDWDEMLQRASIVKRSFLLPLAELLDFDFRNKVRVENRNYFVRELEFSVTQRGVSPASCTLVSVS